MKPDYLVLKDGRSIRIEWNANALALFTAISGIQLSQLINMKPDVPTLRVLAWCSAIEGEAADGKELGLSELELGRLMSMDNIIKFSEILSRQSGSEGEKKKSPPEKPRRVFFRRWR